MRRPEESPNQVRAAGALVDALTLLAVLDEAAEAAAAAEVLLTSCAEGVRLRPADARSGLHLRFRFAQLGRWIEELELSPSETDIRDECSRLLAFYLHMLTHALDARFALQPRDRLAIRSGGPLTGAPAARLIVLRDRLRAAT